MSWKLYALVILCLLYLSADCGAVTLTSGHTVIVFDTTSHHARLTQLSGGATGYAFVNGANAGQDLWTIELRTPHGEEKSAVTLAESQAQLTKVRTSDDGDKLFLTWLDVPITGEKASLDVRVTVSALPNSMTDWRINVANRSKEKGVWLVKFPRIVGLKIGTSGQAATPFGMGQIYNDPMRDPHFAFDGMYPSALYSMQFASLSDAGSCLYLATHDPHAYIKKMRFGHVPDSSDLLYEITQLPPNMGVIGQNYAQPYPCIVGTMPGDWVNAAKFYRKWVLANSDWMKGKKPLAQRKDMPDWLKRLPYWVGFHGMTDANMALIAADIKAIGVPAAVHMYHWHQIQFDHKYPDFWPPWPNTRGYIDQIHTGGAKAMPYINLRLMDELSDSWKPDGAERYAVKNADGSLDMEIDDPSRHMVSMCPATEYWQTKFDPLAVKLTRDLNVDGIYCDQVSAAPPIPCFDPSHGHPLGGGYYWVSGYAKMIGNIRKSAASVKKDVFLTTESAAEPYDFDIYLRCNEGAPFLTPIWQQVYSGYRLSYGFYFYEEREWVAKFATQYLWGVQIGWQGQHDPAANPADSRFERECARARYAGSDYLALGEMLRAPKLTGDFARYKTTWRNFGTLLPIDWPSVQGSLWKAPDGSLGLALVNLHTEPQKMTFEINRDDVGFGKGTVTLSALYPKGLCPTTTLSGSALTSSVTLPAQSVVMLTLRRAR